MLLGMGIVFGFLILLVFVLRLMSWLAGRLAPAEQVAAGSPSHAAPGVTDSTLIAVLGAAVTRYRARRQR